MCPAREFCHEDLDRRVAVLCRATNTWLCICCGCIVVRTCRSAAAGTSQPVSQTSVAAAAAVVPVGGVSERLKAANRELIDKCKRRLTEEGFAAFRSESGRFMRGEMAAGDFHDLMVR